MRKFHSDSQRMDDIAYRLQAMIDNHAKSKWHHYPNGRSPKGSPELYRELAKTATQERYEEIDKLEERHGFSIDKNWLDELALHTQITIKKSKLCYQHGRVLYTVLASYIRENPLANHPMTILDVGTARGFSSLCMAKSLHDTNAFGKILTFDVLPHNVKMYWNCIDDADGPKTRSQLLKNYTSFIEKYIVFIEGDVRLMLPKMQVPRVNFAFIDGPHTYKDVWQQFDWLNQKQNKGDIIVFDDYNEKQFPGVVGAVDEICSLHCYEKEIVSTTSNRSYAIAVKN